MPWLWLILNRNRSVKLGLLVNFPNLSFSAPDSGIHLGRVDEDFSVTTPELLTPGEIWVLIADLYLHPFSCQPFCFTIAPRFSGSLMLFLLISYVSKNRNLLKTDSICKPLEIRYRKV